MDRGASGYSQWSHKEMYKTKQLTQERTDYLVGNQQGDDDGLNYLQV